MIYMSSGGVSPEDINSTQVSLEGSDSRAHITPVGKSASHSQSNPFSVLYYNARSLFPKMDCLHALVSIHKPDTICIVETWLCPDITAVEISYLAGIYACWVVGVMPRCIIHQVTLSMCRAGRADSIIHQVTGWLYRAGSMVFLASSYLARIYACWAVDVLVLFCCHLSVTSLLSKTA